MQPDDLEPVEEGGDPACWAHLFDDDPPALEIDDTDSVRPRRAPHHREQPPARS